MCASAAAVGSATSPPAVPRRIGPPNVSVTRSIVVLAVAPRAGLVAVTRREPGDRGSTRGDHGRIAASIEVVSARVISAPGRCCAATSGRRRSPRRRASAGPAACAARRRRPASAPAGPSRCPYRRSLRSAIPRSATVGRASWRRSLRSASARGRPCWSGRRAWPSGRSWPAQRAWARSRAGSGAVAAASWSLAISASAALYAALTLATSPVAPPTWERRAAALQRVALGADGLAAPGLPRAPLALAVLRRRSSRWRRRSAGTRARSRRSRCCSRWTSRTCSR